MAVQKSEVQLPERTSRQRIVIGALRQMTQFSRLSDRKRGIRSYQSHVKDDPWFPVLLLFCFVIPVLTGVIYYGMIASDLYVTEASFVVRPSINGTDKATPDTIGATAGTPGDAIAQDTLITLDYINSRPMLEEIEKKFPIRDWFGRSDIDYFSRLDPKISIEKLLRYWDRRISIDVETSKGILTLTVEAFDPAESFALTKSIINEAERMLNELSVRAREDALTESARELQIALERLSEIRTKIRDLRNREGVIDAQKLNDANLKVITELRAARINLAIQLAIGQRDLGPEARRIIDIKQQIKNLDDNIARVERASTNQDPLQKRLLSDAITRFEALDNERKNAEKYYLQAQTAHEKARIIASRQVVTLSPIVQPVMAESSVRPRRMLMISLVAAGSALIFVAATFVRKLMI